ncbi:MAG: serine/threonine protein kinase [Candidatus Riflebacteria bacterium]|nr:serine/threonine protein kinase [Candidatus Riflebacteria bacterium]
MERVGGQRDAEEEFPSGQVIAGQYVIEHKLGSGGMGAVYRARQMNLGRVVALKVLKGQVSGGLSERERFVREAKLLTRLRHPNLVTIFDAEVAVEPRYIAMELVTGCALLDLLEAKGRAQALEPLTMAIGLAEALAYIHGEGVLHRDLKPANVLLRDGKHALLADFGLAREHGASSLTTEGFVVGTPAYLAPEQIEQGGASVQSDLYQLGLVLYELFAGQLVFGTLEAGAGQMLSLRLSGRIPDLAGIAARCDPRVAAVVMRCIQRRPERRYPDAPALLAALRPLAPPSESLPVKGPSAGRSAQQAGAAPDRGRPTRLEATAGQAPARGKAVRVDAAGLRREETGSHGRPARHAVLAVAVFALAGMGVAALLSRGASEQPAVGSGAPTVRPSVRAVHWSFDPKTTLLSAGLSIDPPAGWRFELSSGRGGLTTSAGADGTLLSLPHTAGETFAISAIPGHGATPVRLTQAELTAQLLAEGMRLRSALEQFWSRTRLTDQALVDRMRSLIGTRGLPDSGREAASKKVRAWLTAQGLLVPVERFLGLSPLYFDSADVPIEARLALYKVLSPLEVVDATCAAYGLPAPFGRVIADHTGATFRQEQEPDLTGWESYSFQEPEGDGMIGFKGTLDVPQALTATATLVGAHLHFDSTGILKMVVNGLPIYFSKRPARQYASNYRLDVRFTSGRGGGFGPAFHTYHAENVALLAHRIPPQLVNQRRVTVRVTSLWVIPPLFLERNAVQLLWVSYFWPGSPVAR